LHEGRNSKETEELIDFSISCIPVPLSFIVLRYSLNGDIKANEDKFDNDRLSRVFAND
jgi:hypothetical protein